MTRTPNPYQDVDGWYWYDEASGAHGPYTTEVEALRELDGYCRWLSGDSEPEEAL